MPKRLADILTLDGRSLFLANIDEIWEEVEL